MPVIITGAMFTIVLFIPAVCLRCSVSTVLATLLPLIAGIVLYYRDK
ncbi:hypothetical protein JOC37_001346 [Desulfohalotomaculum tongense]|nr:hypothetical protein [Desulforadius tongensis]